MLLLLKLSRCDHVGAGTKKSSQGCGGVPSFSAPHLAASIWGKHGSSCPHALPAHLLRSCTQLEHCPWTSPVGRVWAFLQVLSKPGPSCCQSSWDHQADAAMCAGFLRAARNCSMASKGPCDRTHTVSVNIFMM